MVRWVAVMAAITLVGTVGVSAAGAQGKFPAVDQPGVSDTEIRVGGIVSDQGDPTNGFLESSFDGTEAYFDYINKTEGGVYGRKLVLDSKRDDMLANNRAEVQGLLTQDDVFAALPIAVQLFSGAQLLADEGIPTFGWLINEEWGSENNTPGPPNLFGQTGSFICFTCGQPRVEPWLAQKLKKKNVGILAFAVPQSEGCAEGLENSFKKFGTAKVKFVDKSLGFGQPDYSAQVAQMKEEGVDFVVSCIDGNGAVNLAREIKKQGLDAVQMLPNLYNADLVKENADVLDGNYLFTTAAPFETKPKPPGLKAYDTWIKKSGGDKNENSLVGWINADLFVAGLKAAGPDFTREKVVDAINAMKGYNAGGLVPAIDWTKAHEDQGDCYAVLQVQDGKFAPKFGEPGKPFLCFPPDLKKLPAKPQVSS
ncbi:MAG: ABC transporter substrate-binding protein [Acidimicrobiia bacterium]